MSNPERGPEFTDMIVAGGETLAWGRRTYVMGIINLTPDSFSGDGLGRNVDAALAQALLMEEEGADFLDLGAESTRPGANPISAEEELSRLLPALEAIAGRVSIPISVDTYKAPVARAAMNAGAWIINDVWGFKADPDVPCVVAETGASLIVMHNQDRAEYANLLPEVLSGLSRSVEQAKQAGVPEGKIMVDPGIGFGKTGDHNLEILGNLADFTALGMPVMVGVSRKSTIGRLLDLPPDQRTEGTAAAVALSIAGGADVVRVHDVAFMARVCRMSDAVVRGWRPKGWSR